MSTFEELKARRERERRLFEISSGKAEGSALKGVAREAAYHTAASVGGNINVAVTPEDRMRQQIPVVRSFSPVQTRAPREIIAPETAVVRMSPARLPVSPAGAVVAGSPSQSRFVTGYSSPVRPLRVAGYTSPVREVRAERTITVTSPVQLEDAKSQYRVAVAPGSPGVSSTLVHREIPIQVPVEVPREVPVDRVFKCLERVPVPIKHERQIKVPVTKVVKKPVTRIVEIPVERIVEKLVTRRVTRVVEVPVERIIEKPVEKIVEVKVEKVIEVPVDRVVVKKVNVPYEVVVEKTVEVPVERIIPRVVEKTVEKIIEVPVERLVEQTVEIALEHLIQHDIEVPVERVIEKIMEVPVERVIEKIIDVPVEKVVERIVEVPVEKYIEKYVESDPIIVTKEMVKEVYVQREPNVQEIQEEVVEYVTHTHEEKVEVPEYDYSQISAEYGKRRESMRSVGSMRKVVEYDVVSQPVVTETSYSYTTDVTGGGGAGAEAYYSSGGAAYGGADQYGGQYQYSTGGQYGADAGAGGGYYTTTTVTTDGGMDDYEKIASQFSIQRTASKSGSFRQQQEAEF